MAGKDKGYKLIDLATGNAIAIGEIVTTFRGEQATLIDWEAPRSVASTGRVYVKFEAGYSQGYFPSVINAEIVQYCICRNGEHILDGGECVPPEEEVDE